MPSIKLTKGCINSTFALLTVCSLSMAPEPARSQNLAIAYCSTTKSYGHFVRRNADEAARFALRRCVEDGGDEGCCEVVATASDGSCAALAYAPNGNYGVGEAEKQTEASSKAAIDCGEPGCVTKIARCAEILGGK